MGVPKALREAEFDVGDVQWATAVDRATLAEWRRRNLLDVGRVQRGAAGTVFDRDDVQRIALMQELADAGLDQTRAGLVAALVEMPVFDPAARSWVLVPPRHPDRPLFEYLRGSPKGALQREGGGAPSRAGVLVNVAASAADVDLLLAQRLWRRLGNKFSMEELGLV